MFPCTECGEKYTLKDVEKGNYFPSTGVCLFCYQKKKKSNSTCFGKKDKFDLNVIACGHACPDARVCRAFVKHPKDFK